MTKGEAFIADAIQYEGEACLLWPYAVTAHGYGQVGTRRKDRRVHSIICLAAHGPKPSPAHEVAHRCGVKLCCNKRHLRWATSAENNADKKLHGTHLEGERQPNAKLTAEQVIAIRAEPTSRGLKTKYHVSQQTIGDIRAGRRWIFLKDDAARND